MLIQRKHFKHHNHYIILFSLSLAIPQISFPFCRFTKAKLHGGVLEDDGIVGSFH